MIAVEYLIAVPVLVGLALLFYRHMQQTIERIPVWIRHPIRRGERNMPRIWLVTGGTTTIGQSLIRALIERGDDVLVHAKSKECVTHLFGPQVQFVGNMDELPDHQRIDVMVQLEGMTLAGTGRAKVDLPDRTTGAIRLTEDMVRLVQRMQRPPGLLIAGSSIACYDHSNLAEITENSAVGKTGAAAHYRELEMAARKAEAYGVRVVRLRAGAVIDQNTRRFTQSRILMTLANALRNSDQLNWISLDDLIGIIFHAEDRTRVNGAVNAVAPEPATRDEVVRQTAGHGLSGFLIEVVAGLSAMLPNAQPDQGAAGAPVRPIQASKTGFHFRHPALAEVMSPAEADTKAGKGEALAFFNMDCPVCGTEARMCQRQIDRNADNIGMGVVHMSDRPDLLAAFGLEPGHLSRRLYIMEADGSMHAGIDAMIRIWEKIPAYRWRAGLLRLPVLYLTAHYAYETVVAPFVDSRFGINSPRAKRRARSLQRSESG